MERPPENDLCSVCHSRFYLPCQANCSHWFCANCILQVWNYGPSLQPCKCPLCRRQITLLIPSDSLSRHHGNAEVSEIVNKVERYNRLFGERPNSLSQRMQDLPFLVRRLFGHISDPARTLPFFIRARVYLAAAASVIYVISPLDLIPEAILGIFGLLDDIIIVLICFLYVASIYRSFLLALHRGHNGEESNMVKVGDSC